MNEFKVGDRVEIVDLNTQVNELHIYIGRRGTVVGVDNADLHPIHVRLDRTEGETTEIIGNFEASELKKIEGDLGFEVGDRVKINCLEDDTTGAMYNGIAGTVKRIFEGKVFPIAVELDSHTVGFMPDELIKID